MNITVLSNTQKYPYHTQIAKAMDTIVSITSSNAQIIDIKNVHLSHFTQQLSSSTPDIIITLDLAGFEFRTLTGECLLNMLPGNVCNILWGDKPEYNKYLTGKLSLSMLFYDATGTDNQLPAKYPYMRYYYPTPQAIPASTYSDNTSETQTSEALLNIWEHFTKEVLL